MFQTDLIYYCCYSAGVALLVGLIFYYMKYKSLEKHYRQMSEKDHDEDEMKVVYHEEMQAGNSCKILCTLLFLKRGKTNYLYLLPVLCVGGRWG